MGIASLVLGIISIIIAFIPLCGAIAFLPAIVGLILGIVDVVLKSKKGEKKGLSIAGLVLSAIALLIIFIWLVIIGAGSTALVNELNQINWNDVIQNSSR